MQDPLTPKPFRLHLEETGRLVWLAVRLVWRASPQLAAGILLLMALQAALPPLQLAISRAVVDRAASDLQALGLGGAGHDLDPLVLWLPLGGWIALAAATFVAGQVIQPVAGTLQAVAGDRLTGYVAEQLIHATNRWQGLARFEDPAFQDDLERACKQAATGSLEVLTYGGRAVLQAFTAVGLALVLAKLHPLAPVLLVGATLPQMARQWEFRHRTLSYIYVQTPEARRLGYTRDVVLTPEAAKDVRLYGLVPFFAQRYEGLFERAFVTVDRMRRRLSLHVSLASGPAAAAGGAIYVYVVLLVTQGQATIGDLALYGGAATLLQDRLLWLGFELGFLPLPLGFLPSLFRILDAPPDLPVPAHPRPAPRPIREGITFEHVAFAYPGETKNEEPALSLPKGRTTKGIDPGAARAPSSSVQPALSLPKGPSSVPVLRDVSVTIRPGECVALVGHNGAGKTTLIKLLLRLYDPTEGRILLDGIALQEYDLNHLRHQTAVIFQDFVRYELTAGENVGLGQVDTRQDKERLLEAARRAGAVGLIEQLPQGLDTPLGRELGARELSGGEWQKLALARAFMRARLTPGPSPIKGEGSQAPPLVPRGRRGQRTGRRSSLPSPLMGEGPGVRVLRCSCSTSRPRRWMRTPSTGYSCGSANWWPARRRC